MAQDKKFGTFSGVFTPSILTILGVIMYMRLGWVVGQAGIIGTLAIILFAHIISITTGLSISSIATDKKIKAGGIYYILSRSLGLPMGGAIGIALFTGTALSISLYIIGFAENFLSIPAISEFTGLEPSINSYRIVGTVVIIVLVILAFISTSLAIKTQYFILGAIGLSLVSIFVGFAVNPDFIPETPVLFKAENGLSFEKVFAIFFPAVTGFTAGVAMSGDLRDPKKNIPKGTLWAIAVGFVTYIILAVMFGIFVNRETLLNDNSMIMNVAWIPPLVVAGIWGATLSSALGGILGGPRILQALSKDSVTPRIFAKGYGSTNEPRNALIMIFLIAEAGIMIGSLNVIAGIVTMFYLTSYGFINLAYVLENWASTDFRPSFKVSRIFGIVGFIFAFAIMFKLDVVSMLVAFVIIGLIYFILQRKQLKLDYGDVWQSVWLSVVRRGLNVLDNKNMEDRNWQPNIILFSGASEKRPHLIEFGRSLVGKFGFLSNFDLTVDKDTDVLFPKHKQSIPEKANPEAAVFTRRQSCKDIYDGIEMIARTYGFSGIEPNTAIMGWGRQSQNPEKFVRLIKTINDLDYNILLVDYDKRFGYGKYKQIDIWWRGAGNNGNFALTLSKFMVASEKWENAKIRLMIVNSEDSKAFYIYRQATEILDFMRIEADVKIINNEVEKTPFYDIIRVESKNADIVFIGIPGIQEGKEQEFVERTNDLLHKIGTVVLLSASSLFKEMNLGVNLKQKSVISATENLIASKDIANELINSKHVELNEQVKTNFEGIVNIYEKTVATYTFKESDEFLLFVQTYQEFVNDIFAVLLTNIGAMSPAKRRAYITKYQSILLLKVNKEVEIFKQNKIPALNEVLTDVLVDFTNQSKQFFGGIAEDILLEFPKEEFFAKKNDSTKFRFFKFYSKNFRKKNDKVYISYTAKSRINTIKPKFYEVLAQQIEQLRIETLRFAYVFNEMVLKTVNSLEQLKNSADSENILKLIETEKNIFEKNYLELEVQSKDIVRNVIKNRKRVLIQALNSFLLNANTVEKFYKNREKKLKKKQIKELENDITTKKDLLFSSFELFVNYVQTKNRIKTFNLQVVDKINKLSHRTEKISQQILENKSIKNFNVIEEEINLAVSETTTQIADSVKDLPKEISLMDESSLNDSFYKNFSEIKTVKILLPQVIEVIVNETVLEKIKKSSQTLTDGLKKEFHGEKDSQKISEITETFIHELKEIKSEVALLRLHNIVGKN